MSSAQKCLIPMATLEYSQDINRLIDFSMFMTRKVRFSSITQDSLKTRLSQNLLLIISTDA